MADKKISELDSASLPLAGTEIVPIVQGGVTKKVAVSEIGSDTPFDPSNYDLEDFTNESSDPFVRQSEIPSGTTPDLDAVTQEGNVTRVEIVRDVTDFETELQDGLVFDNFGDKTNAIGWDSFTSKIYIKSASQESENFASYKLFDFEKLTDLRFTKKYQNEVIQEDFPIVEKDTDFTANTNVLYLCKDDLEITDPTAQGYYKFFVLNGTTTIGTETYTQGASVQRYYDGSDWVSFSVTDELNNKISKHVGATYTTNAIQTVTQSEYDAIGTPDANTLYFII
jgi:hypothetical protein